MTRGLCAVLLGAGIVVATSSARANVYTYSGPTVTIPDPVAFGESASPATIDIVVPDSFVIGTVSVSITLNHDAIGDLVATLTRDGDTPVTVDLFRTVNAISDPPYTSSGDDDNLSGIYTFADTATTRLLDAVSLVSDSVVAPGTYRATTNDFSGNETAVSLDAAFFGLDAGGTWTLSIEDKFHLDTGSISAWSVSLSEGQVPEPGAALVVAAAIGAMGMRRRR